MNYTEANDMLQGRCKESRKIGNNTYLLRRGPEIAIRLHNTDIMTLRSNGDIVLDTDGWLTVTTKQRLNEYSRKLGYSIWSERGTWHISMGGNRVLNWKTQTPNPNYREYRFHDGMVIHSDGSTDAEPFVENGDRKLKARVNRFVAGYMAAMENGKVPAPGPGDCLYCALRPTNVSDVQIGPYKGKSASGFGSGDRTMGEAFGDKGHILSHMTEKYYVPSLLMRALEVFPKSPVMQWWMASFWAPDGPNGPTQDQRLSTRQAGGDFAKQQISKVLKRYILRQLGFQA